MSTAVSESSGPSSSAPSHPLLCKWNYYYNPPAKAPAPGEAWTSNVKRVNSFDTVEGFWRLINVIKSPANLVPRTDYYMFKDGIAPEWEDPANADGGKWAFALPKKEGNQKIDETWLHLLLALIGEQFEDSEEIAGAVIGRRGQEFRFALWLKNGAKADIVKKIGVQLKHFTDFNQPIGFSFHSDSLKLKHFAANEKKYTA